MGNKMLIGIAVGAVLGMVVASKNYKVRQAVSEAEDVVKSKICSSSDCCGQASQSNEA